MKTLPVCLLLLWALPAPALLIDDFEEGAFNLVGPTSASQILPVRTDAQILGGERTVTVSADAQAVLVPDPSFETRAQLFFLAGGSQIDFDYALSSPLDVTQGQPRAWLSADWDNYDDERTIELRLEDADATIETHGVPIPANVGNGETFLDLATFTSVDLPESWRCA